MVGMNDMPAARLDRLPAHNDDGDVLAIVEACVGSSNKLKYDPRLGAFALHHVLPAGMSFPWDLDLKPRVLDEIERFFVVYNRERDVEFRPLGRGGAKKAQQLLQQGCKAFIAERVDDHP